MPPLGVLASIDGLLDGRRGVRLVPEAGAIQGAEKNEVVAVWWEKRQRVRRRHTGWEGLFRSYPFGKSS